MSNFVLIFVCLGLGFILKKLERLPDSAPRAFNEFIITLSLPALILVQLPQLLQTATLDRNLLIPISMSWIMFFLSAFTFVQLGRRLNWSQPKIGALVLTAGLGNTSFVGFPLLEALIGNEAVRIGVLVDQPGTFLVVSTLGIIAGAYFSGGRVDAQIIFKRVFGFPPFIALIASLLWHFSGTTQGEVATTWLLPMLSKLASTLVPLALVSVGYQLKVNPALLRRRWLPLACGLGFKLILMPALFALAYYQVLGMEGLLVHVTVLEAAMAPMITSAIVAAEFHLDTELANLMVGIGIPLSLMSVPLWHFVISN
jgi:malate permease and related proteins